MDILIEKIITDCPICNRVHQIEIRKRDSRALIKGESVNFEETYYLCPDGGYEDDEFVPAGVMDENLARARDAYREKHGFFTIKDCAADEHPKNRALLNDYYFYEQREKIREIELSERKFYQKITDLYATACDFDVNAATTVRFYNSIRKQFIWAIKEPESIKGCEAEIQEIITAMLTTAKDLVSNHISVTMEKWERILRCYASAINEKVQK